MRYHVVVDASVCREWKSREISQEADRRQSRQIRRTYAMESLCVQLCEKSVVGVVCFMWTLTFRCDAVGPASRGTRTDVSGGGEP